MKISPHLSHLAIRDLTKISGLTFTYPDRLTRTETETVLNWARAQPVILQALRSGDGAARDSVRLFQGVVDYFAQEHPQTAAGDPEPWQGGRLLPDDAPIDSMSAEEAGARLAWARTTAEYQDGYLNAAHPQHAILVAQTAKLLERSSEAAPIVPTVGGPDKPTGEAQARIDVAQSDPAYLDASSPHHKAAVQTVSEAFAAAYQQPGAAAATRSQATAPSFQEVTRAIAEHPAYADRWHPQHAAKVAEMTAAFEAAYPEPSAGGQ